MSRYRVAVVVGNPKVGSRTRTVAEEVARQCEAGLDAPADRTVVELSEIAARLFDWAAEDVTAMNDLVAGADLAVIASPTYKATYTGLLKAFLDRYGNRGLAGVVAVPVMVGAAPAHHLAPEMGLRPLLVELGASVPTRSLYVMESELDDLAGVVSRWAETEVPIVGRSVVPRSG